ncbi:10708_t:CDS:2 [Acaulospora morrowiae]|uniref:10708_t:CDS:1 n=1 Tax=Acaulospora morrowiae TaxID=94023 RepID=A0A9N8VWW0_9GLOM|nr:10708_t:CDS:2 [Acaulospora morrowiae]
MANERQPTNSFKMREPSVLDWITLVYLNHLVQFRPRLRRGMCKSSPPPRHCDTHYVLIKIDLFLIPDTPSFYRSDLYNWGQNAFKVFRNHVARINLGNEDKHTCHKPQSMIPYY